MALPKKNSTVHTILKTVLCTPEHGHCVIVKRGHPRAFRQSRFSSISTKMIFCLTILGVIGLHQYIVRNCSPPPVLEAEEGRKEEWATASSHLSGAADGVLAVLSTDGASSRREVRSWFSQRRSSSHGNGPPVPRRAASGRRRRSSVVLTNGPMTLRAQRLGGGVHRCRRDDWFPRYLPHFPRRSNQCKQWFCDTWGRLGPVYLNTALRRMSLCSDTRRPEGRFIGRAWARKWSMGHFYSPLV